MIPVQQVRVWFEDGNSLVTRINGTREDVISYYVGNVFNVGVVEDNMVKCTSVHFLA